MKVINVIQFGFKVVAAVTAVYLVDKMMEKKVDELIEEGGVLNAIALGAGQGAIEAVVGTIVFMVY